eukprot:TRINITY_DN2566_c0_g1_i1.p1 TRINITY_DN2566_c0_g1~~TRINITY_DN2566_c0_g1_i1.p1  ORF type:complete len:413 (-),score=53.36 TRINITY_DN2566_c0_g1_i1:230-1468(-)
MREQVQGYEDSVKKMLLALSNVTYDSKQAKEEVKDAPFKSTGSCEGTPIPGDTNKCETPLGPTLPKLDERAAECQETCRGRHIEQGTSTRSCKAVTVNSSTMECCYLNLLTTSQVERSAKPCYIRPKVNPVHQLKNPREVANWLRKSVMCDGCANKSETFFATTGTEGEEGAPQGLNGLALSTLTPLLIEKYLLSGGSTPSDEALYIKCRMNALEMGTPRVNCETWNKWAKDTASSVASSVASTAVNIASAAWSGMNWFRGSKGNPEAKAVQSKSPGKPQTGDPGAVARLMDWSFLLMDGYFLAGHLKTGAMVAKGLLAMSDPFAYLATTIYLLSRAAQLEWTSCAAVEQLLYKEDLSAAVKDVGEKGATASPENPPATTDVGQQTGPDDHEEFFDAVGDDDEEFFDAIGGD